MSIDNTYKICNVCHYANKNHKNKIDNYDDDERENGYMRDIILHTQQSKLTANDIA